MVHSRQTQENGEDVCEKERPNAKAAETRQESGYRLNPSSDEQLTDIERLMNPSQLFMALSRCGNELAPKSMIDFGANIVYDIVAARKLCARRS